MANPMNTMRVADANAFIRECLPVPRSMGTRIREEGESWTQWYLYDRADVEQYLGTNIEAWLYTEMGGSDYDDRPQMQETIDRRASNARRRLAELLTMEYAYSGGPGQGFSHGPDIGCITKHRLLIKRFGGLDI